MSSGPDEGFQTLAGLFLPAIVKRSLQLNFPGCFLIDRRIPELITGPILSYSGLSYSLSSPGLHKSCGTSHDSRVSSRRILGRCGGVAEA